MGDKIWERDSERTAAAVLELKPYDLENRQPGLADHVVLFLKDSGLWETLINAQPTLLKKKNGINVQQLNELMLVKELSGIKRIAHAEPLLRDGDLLAELGFNIEKLNGDEEPGIIHQNSLRNHLDRIPQEESYAKWYEHIEFLRKKKWMRGGLYALDGYELEVSLDKSEYENAGKVWCPAENRWKYGYKLLLLANVQEGRERIVGAYLDRIEVHETQIFYKMIGHIEKYLCPLGALIQTLLLDRAYWDEKLLRYLKEEKGVDWVTLGKSNTLLVKERLAEDVKHGYLEFKSYQMKNSSHYERTTDKNIVKKSMEPEYFDMELATATGLDFKPFDKGYLNTVIRKSYTPKETTYTYFITTLPVKNPVKIVELYGSRWTIENDVNRELDQRWYLRSLAGRTLNIILARIMIVLKLYNSEKILEMKKLKTYQQLKEKLRAQGDHNFLKKPRGANVIIIYITGQNIFGTFSAKQFQVMIEKRLSLELISKLNLKSGDMISADDLLKILNKN